MNGLSALAFAYKNDPTIAAVVPRTTGKKAEIEINSEEKSTFILPSNEEWKEKWRDISS